jgi:sugar lactone lactonase YvrE
MRIRLVALAPVVLSLASAAFAAQPQFWRLEGARDFLDGDTEGLSVDSEGRMRLAPATRAVHDPEAPFVWSLAVDGGRVYAGTGNDGKVFLVEGGKGSLFFDAPELEVHAVLAGPGDKVLVGSSPEGKVYAVDRAGKSETLFDPAEKYVWSLAVDAQGRVLVGTGPDGKIHRVDKAGKADVLFVAPEGHVTALAADKAGNVYAGTTPGGVVYRIDSAGKVHVLHDSSYREVKSLALAPDGTVYAALVDGKDDASRTAPLVFTPSSTPAAPMGEVTVTESFSLGPPAAPLASPSPRPLETVRLGGSKGALLRVSPSGEVETLWSSTEEMPHALAVSGDGVLVGTGDKGKLYRVRDDRTWTMIAAFPGEQVTSLAAGTGGAVFLATSNPGRLHSLDSTPGTKGMFTSKPRDTDTASSWGRIRWDAVTPAGTSVQVQTRSGNTGTPDATWSAWSTAYTQADGSAVASDSARFLQVRAVVAGASGQTPVVDTITAAYLQKNLRPQIQTVTIHPPGEVFQKPISLSGEVDILGTDEPRNPEGRPGAATPRTSMPSATTYSRRLYQKGMQTLSWKGEDPNGDTLAYDVYYRPLNDTRYRLLKKALTDAVVAWDTTTVPNGRYVVKVVASDAPANPPSVALVGEKESTAFEVDNTPPLVTVTLAEARRVKVSVRDDASVVRRVEYSVDGGRWQEVHPTDGINDSLQEQFDFTVTDLTGPAPHVVVVRAADLLGNLSTGRVEIP